VIHREKQSVKRVGQVREVDRSRTTVITRQPSNPVRTDGAVRTTTIERKSSVSRPAVTQKQVVRERSSTRVQPSSNGTRVTKTETRREIKRR
jgi:hypothetical protein